MKSKNKFEPAKLKLNVKRSKTGLGIFAGEPIKKGTCIIEYIGRVINEDEKYKSKSKYLFEVDSKMTIDGSSRSNIARYINHSCRPNAEIEIKNKRIFVLALKNIKEGEEIAYDYDTEYFEEHIKPKGCKCVKCLK